MMDIPMIDSYLETLAGYICDEDKLVTYKWLSKELEVHVNIAKIILWRYWQKHKNDVLVATFMLIGNLKDGGMRVEVVKDNDLEKAKEKFEKIISEHIYSLQKTLLDVELLAGAGRGDSKYSAITCAKSVILSEDELLAMRWGKAQPPKGASTEKKALPQAQNKKEPATVKETIKKEDNNKETEAKSEEKQKKNSPPKQKSNEKKGTSKKPVQSTKAGFGQLFAKAGNQQKPQTSFSNNSTKENGKKDSELSSEKKSLKSAAETLFGKGKAKENEDSTNVPMEVEVSSPEEKEVKKSSSDSKNSEKTEKTDKNDKSATSKKNKQSKTKKSSRGTKRGRSQDSGEEIKKRKRIIIASDSSEESANESANEDIFESPPPPSPKKDKSPSPPPVKQEGNKRKVRKLVDKTFMDEDGFLITKKEHVWESCSDEEPEIVEKKKKVETEKPKETKETKMPVKKKQTSLMSFFKKA